VKKKEEKFSSCPSELVSFDTVEATLMHFLIGIPPPPKKKCKIL